MTLKEKVLAGVNRTDCVFGFFGEYRWMSNFHPIDIVWEGIVYPTTEHAFQASKTISIEEKKIISSVAKPSEAKRVGGKVSLRADWELIKVPTMLQINLIKFQNSVLAEKLLSTDGMYLEETNWWGDTFWGVCDFKGKNILGEILMLIRKQIKN